MISTDGDFIPIALIQLEKRRREGHSQANIFVHRIKIKTSTATKRNATGTSKREFEFVNVGALLDGLTHDLPWTDTPAAYFSTLVALSGCDFSMNLPALGPTKLWAARTKLRDNPLRECAHLVTALIVTYQQILQNKCAGARPKTTRSITDTQTAKLVYGQQHASALRCLTLAPRTKTSLWAPDRIVAHACNVMWTLKYWSLLHAAPDPFSGNFGFVLVKKICAFEASDKVANAPKQAAN